MDDAPDSTTTADATAARTSAPHGAGRVIRPLHTCPAATVLVVDDEDLVRGAAKRILERAGFRVLVAADGIEALDVYDARADEIGCVLLDLVMPRMDGEGMLAALRKRGAGIPVICSSGCSGEEAARELALGEADAFIQKPYQSAALIAAIRTALHAGGPA
ncbi:MAG: response regulator [Candidatus Hydrogenedentes bacterium]|nr:response regulator [Candidatus Hydrogenedentota bacterium]